MGWHVATTDWYDCPYSNKYMKMVINQTYESWRSSSCHQQIKEDEKDCIKNRAIEKFLAKLEELSQATLKTWATIQIKEPDRNGTFLSFSKKGVRKSQKLKTSALEGNLGSKSNQTTKNTMDRKLSQKLYQVSSIIYSIQNMTSTTWNVIIQEEIPTVMTEVQKLQVGKAIGQDRIAMDILNKISDDFYNIFLFLKGLLITFMLSTTFCKCFGSHP